MAELTMNGDPRPVAGDPRAVRVSLDAESHPGDARAVRVSPVTGPLQMTNPTVGRGPFGARRWRHWANRRPVSLRKDSSS